MRISQFRTRWLMVVVALVAVVMSGVHEIGKLRRLSREYHRRSRTFGTEVRALNWGLTGIVSSAAEANRLSTDLRLKDPDLARLWAAEAAAYSREVVEWQVLLSHYARLQKKYEHAAAHPWETVTIDPPEPRITPAWRCVRQVNRAARPPN